MSEAMMHPTETVKEYPVSSMLVVFGVGIGVGVLLAQTLCDPMIRAWQPEPTMSEKMSQRVAEALQSVSPEWLNRRFAS
jgi:hypothetical protein